jgi:hypothetical protein
MRRAMSSAISTPLPVMPMKVRALSGTFFVFPMTRTIAGFSVGADANMSDESSLALKLSRNTAGRASTRADVRRLSSSASSCLLVNADGLAPLLV